MPAVWTAEQIIKLAPDASSAQAGRSLANPRKWVSLGLNERAAWGECQGSGQQPYQTQIDRSESAFKCSCPSRKFPCKHGLALALLMESHPAAFTQTALPAWVSEWLESRAKRTTQKSKKEKSGAGPVDEAARAKRAAGRETKVEAGVRELEIWLYDLVRQGLAASQHQPYTFWDAPAARMVDAQAAGLARLLREMAGTGASGSGWPERLLERLGLLHLLIEGWKNLSALPPTVQADVRSLIGWTWNQEELLAEEGLHDRWLVLAQQVEDEERLRVQRTWLWGEGSGQAALVINFAFMGQPLDNGLVAGTSFEGELVYFPGNLPLRALLKQRSVVAPGITYLPGYPSIRRGIEAYAGGLARFPWLEQFPLGLREVVPVRTGERDWALRDLDMQAVAIAPDFEGGWRLLAISGGHPLDVFGVWNGEYFRPLSVFSHNRPQGQFITL